MEPIDLIPMECTIPPTTEMPLDSTPVQTQASPRPTPRSGQKGYRSYTDEAMASAVKSILEEGLSLRQASARFHVPKSTLSERLGNQKPWLDAGRPQNDTRPTVTRYKWNEADMEKALSALQNGERLSISEAAKQFGVPASSLNARYRGRVPRSLKGSQSSLTLQQETLLADWARVQAELGFPATKDQVFALAERVFQREHPDRMLGKQWLAHWMRRYPIVHVLDWNKPERPLQKPVEVEQQPQQQQEQHMPGVGQDETPLYSEGVFRIAVDGEGG